MTHRAAPPTPHLMPVAEAPAPDPLAATVAEVAAAYAVARRERERANDLGQSAAVFARAVVALRSRLVAAHGEAGGGAIWRLALARYTTGPERRSIA